ncbi:hypothetical protein K438DRAFT_1782508 [Mycena galopus ATCC 62051]|nr:hypothetical protein K438DRAFT_1782502 [Mycena galopus ATCC 62051]KAF8144799.1 hypothetical protein K438DRAFT_1782508 [Mycena galopus ATCC 62051]
MARTSGSRRDSHGGVLGDCRSVCFERHSLAPRVLSLAIFPLPVCCRTTGDPSWTLPTRLLDSADIAPESTLVTFTSRLLASLLVCLCPTQLYLRLPSYFQPSRRLTPPDACDALLNLRPYLEQPGHVYVHVRLNKDVLQNPPTIPDDEELDYLDIKVGEAIDMDARRAAYAKCDGEEILWCFYYRTDHPKLIERLTHLTLAHIGAKRVPYPCHGCLVRHREHFSEQCAALEFVATTIEHWIRYIGEVPVRHAMYDE